MSAIVECRHNWLRPPSTPNPWVCEWCGVERAESPPDLCTVVRGYLGYIADVRAGRVKRLDRDVVLTYAAKMESVL